MATAEKIQKWLDLTSKAPKFDAATSIHAWLDLKPTFVDWSDFHTTVIGDAQLSTVTSALYHVIPGALNHDDWPSYIKSVDAHYKNQTIFDYFFKPPQPYGTSVINGLVQHLNSITPTMLRGPRSFLRLCSTTLINSDPAVVFKDDGHPRFAASLHRLSIAAHRHSVVSMNSPTSAQWGPRSLYDEYGLPDEKDLAYSKALNVCLEYVFYQQALTQCTNESEKTLLQCETHELFKRMNLSLDVFESLLDINRSERAHTIGTVMATACMYLIPSTSALELPEALDGPTL